ncbi:MAG: hypothetical protein LBH54_03915 [Clostridiales bacterium]|nr:hypothetical protein [Clostridiales bacterium]
MGKSLCKKGVSGILALTLLAALLCAPVQADVSRTTLFEDDFETDTLLEENYTFFRANSAVYGQWYPDNGTVAGNTPADIRHSVVTDPTGSGRGGVLKLDANYYNFGDFGKYILANRAMTIPLSADYSTVIQYDAATSTPMTGKDEEPTFGYSFFTPILPGQSYANSDNALIAYGGTRTEFNKVVVSSTNAPVVTMPANTWHSVKVDLRLKTAGQDVIVANVDYAGRTVRMELTIANAAANGLGGFTIGQYSYHGLNEWSSLYVDRLKVYTEAPAVPGTYVTSDGIIAVDGAYFPEITVASNSDPVILENIGTGWAEPWPASRRYRYYAFHEVGQNFLMLLGNGVIKRRFTNAINLTVPGIYELSQKNIENSGNSLADMRVYFGSDLFYAGVAGDGATSGTVYPQFKYGSEYWKSNTGFTTLHYFTKMQVVVKSPDGTGDLRVKIWAKNVTEPTEWTHTVTNIDLPATLGTSYLDWAGNYNMLNSTTNYNGNAYFADTTVRKIPGVVARSSYAKTDANGGEIYEVGDIGDSLLVNASFTNSTAGTAAIQPIIAVYDSDDRLTGTVLGTPITVPPFTDTPMAITEFGYDGTNQTLPDGFNSATWKVKVFFWDYFSQSPYVGVDLLSDDY